MNRLGRESVPFLFLVDFEMEKPVVVPLEQTKAQGIYYDIRGIRNRDKRMAANQEISISGIRAVDFDRYHDAFQKIFSHLEQGDSYLVNLTFQSEIQVSVTLETIFDASVAPYKLFYRDEFVVFSPESFIQIQNGTISTFPMKGTMDAALPDARTALVADPKEMAEHVTIVDLLRNDLGRVATNIRVARFRYVDQIQSRQKNLLQVSSEIRGDLAPDYPEHIGDIIYSLLPAGSVSGAPKRKTLDIIKNVEGMKRGYYTGVFGFFDGRNLDSGVMIRFIEKKENKFYYRSGGGITMDSNPLSEYQEMLDKIYVPIG